MTSLNTLRALDPQPRALLPGHGPPIVPLKKLEEGLLPVQLIQQYIDHRNSRISQAGCPPPSPPPTPPPLSLSHTHAWCSIALLTPLVLQVLAAVCKLSAQGLRPEQLKTRHVTEEVIFLSIMLQAANRQAVQVYPGLAASLLGGADANTEQVKAPAAARFITCVFAIVAEVTRSPMPLILQALLLLQQRGSVVMVDGGWQLRATAAL
jgi:hypothetical protein